MRFLRITVKLVDVGTGYNVWSEKYDREMEDVFAIQEEIANRDFEAALVLALVNPRIFKTTNANGLVA